MIIILGPPPSVAYPLILDIEGYPEQIVNSFIVCVSFCLLLWGLRCGNQRPSSYSQGLFWLRWKKPNANRPFKSISTHRILCFKKILTSILLVWLPLAVFFLAASIFRKSPMRPTSSLLTNSNHYKLLVIIVPFLRPANGIGDTPPLPYYLSVSLFDTRVRNHPNLKPICF